MRELMISLAEEVQSKIIVNKSDFDDLREIVRELAEAQKRTGIRMEELVEAQKKTEVRTEELTEAQKRTEKHGIGGQMGVSHLLHKERIAMTFLCIK